MGRSGADVLSAHAPARDLTHHAPRPSRCGATSTSLRVGLSRGLPIHSGARYAGAERNPDRIVVVTSPGGKQFDAIVSSQPNVAKPADELAWLNNYFPKDVIPSGELLKIVKRGGNGA